MANHLLRAQTLFDTHALDKSMDDSRNAHCTVTCLYHAKLVGECRNVTVTWSKNLINHSLHITTDKPESKNRYTCKIDFKPWHFWTKKGYKAFDVEDQRVDVFWDLRSAKFSGGPEPYMDYYVAVVFDEEVVLLVGDLKKKAYKRTKSRPSLIDAVLLWKKENVFGKKSFSTRAKLDQQRKEHDIIVENSLLGPRDPEMWISIDGIVLVHITNLQWKFRGNETVMVNKMPVQIFWDVHDWLFSTPGLGHGVFIFTPVSEKGKVNHLRDMISRSGDTESTMTTSTEETELSQNNVPSAPEFRLFLYAWKTE